MSLSQDELGFLQDEYVCMTGYTSPSLEGKRPSTPGSKSLNDVKQIQVKKTKPSLWKRGKHKMAKWSSTTNVTAAKAEPPMAKNTKDLCSDDDMLNDDYIQMGRKKLSSPAVFGWQVDHKAQSLEDLLDCPPQDHYDTPRSQSLMRPALPPRPGELPSQIHSETLPRHSYEECEIQLKPKPGNGEWDTRSIATTVSLSRDEGLISQLEDSQKYKSISESYSLQNLGANVTLPQFLRVTKGYYSPDEDESLSEGDLLVAYCTKKRNCVLAEDTSGTQFSIPLNSNLKFVLIPMHVTDINEVQNMPKAFCPTVADLAALPYLPCVVKAVQSYSGETEYESVKENTLLFLETKAEKDGKVVLIARDVSGMEYGLREDCCAGFSLSVSDTWLFLSEIVKISTYPQRVFVTTENLPARPLTLLASEEKKYLVASSDISGHHDYHSDFILEIPLHIDVEVECVAHIEKDNTDALEKAARAIYQRINTCPGHLVSETPKSGSDTQFQEELYSAISNLEDLKLIRSNAATAKVKPKVLPKPAVRKNKGPSPASTVVSSPGQSLPQTGTENGQSHTSERKSAVRAPPCEDELKLHMMRANRPLPPPPDATASYVFHTPSGIPAVSADVQKAPVTVAEQRPHPPIPDTFMGSELYSTPSSLPVNGHPLFTSKESMLTNALYVNHNPPPQGSSQRLDEAPGSSAVQMAEQPASKPSPSVMTHEHVPLPSLPPVGVDMLADIREKMVVLENRMHSLHVLNHGNSPVMGPVGPYKEMEKELARVRGRQMKLEALLADYEQRLSRLEAASRQQNVSPSISSDVTKENKAALMSLTQEDVAQVLLSLSLERYTEQFLQEGIDGPVLACMTEQAMDEIGMSKVQQARLLPVVNGFRSCEELLEN